MRCVKWQSTRRPHRGLRANLLIARGVRARLGVARRVRPMARLLHARMPDERRPPPPPPALAGADLAHAIVEGSYALVFPDPQARRALGLRAISRARHDATAWLVWTLARPGAFEMAVIPGECGEPVPAGALVALRYYPSPHEPLYARFAPVERAARASEAFDATGTPRSEAADQIDPSLFHVGTLSLALDHDGIALALDAQDRWVEESRERGRWTVQRDVPGFALAFAMLDPLARALAYLGRRGPAQVHASRTTGTRWRIDDGAAAFAPDPTLAAWRLDARGFALPGLGAAPPADTRPPSVGGDVHRFVPDCRRWWDAAHWRFDPVGSFCSACERADAAHAADGGCTAHGHG